MTGQPTSTQAQEVQEETGLTIISAITASLEKKENIRTLIKDFGEKIDSSDRITFCVCLIVGLLVLFM